jgi:arylsulfatase A-like enzyme
MMRPNVICFVTDQHRADHLGCTGNVDVKTPNLDKLAAEGLIFNKSFVANPVCSPNRACMFTGQYPKAHGLRENGQALSPDAVTLPKVLKENGYQTFSSGKLHLAPFNMTPDMDVEAYKKAESKQLWNEREQQPLPIPYYGLEEVYYVGGHGHYNFGHHKNDMLKTHPTTWEGYTRDGAREPSAVDEEVWCAAIPEELHYNTCIADKTIEFLKDRDHDKPFFIWCSFPDPHHPFCPPAPWFDMYDPEKITIDPVPDEGSEALPVILREYKKRRTRKREVLPEVIAKTYGLISMVDHNIGRVVKELEAEHLMEDTIILFFSDHGDYMGDHGCLRKALIPYDGVWKVPTIWRIPGKEKKTGKTDALHSTVDLMPTILDLAGIEIPDCVQGVSQADVLLGKEVKKRESVYAEHDALWAFPAEDQAERVRYVRTESHMLAYYVTSDFGMLYDTENDPGQQRNLFYDHEHADVANKLMALLLKETAQADPWYPPKECSA